MEKTTIGRMIHFLADCKEDLLRDFSSDVTTMFGRCGALAAAEYMDGIICTMVSKETKIADLKARLNLAEKDVDEYKAILGEDLDAISEGAKNQIRKIVEEDIENDG